MMGSAAIVHRAGGCVGVLGHQFDSRVGEASNMAVERSAGSRSLAHRRSPPTLYAYAKELTGLGRREGIENWRHEQLEMHHAIGWCTKKNHTTRQCSQVLLELDSPVHRDQGVVLPLHPPQKLAVRDARPATTDDRVDAVALQGWGEVYGQLLVKKNAHRPAA